MRRGEFGFDILSLFRGKRKVTSSSETQSESPDLSHQAHLAAQRLGRSRSRIAGRGRHVMAWDHLEPRTLLASNLTGLVFDDVNDNGLFDPTETPIAGVAMRLNGNITGGGTVSLTTNTLADGTYQFSGLNPGTYELIETQPPGYQSGIITVGTQGGTIVAPDSIVNINLPDNVTASGYNYAERSIRVSGNVFVDTDRNGTQTATEPGLPGVTVKLLNSSSAVVQTKVTDSTGKYEFIAVVPDNYTIERTLPVGYGSSTDGSKSVTVPITGLTAQNFGVTTGALSGTVFVDTNNNGVRESTEALLAGVQVKLTGTDVLNAAVTQTTTTGTNGTYTFSGLLAGGYTITQTQPSNFTSGINTAGTAGGTVSGDVVSGITLVGGQIGSGYTFAERGTALTGVTYIDANRNAALDAGEVGLAGVVLTLKKPDGTVVGTATTAADGSYGFANVTPGTYTLEQTQPNGYGSSTGNTLNVTMPALTKANASDPDLPAGLYNQNFGETTASLAGAAYVDNNGNGIRDAAEPAISGVVFTLTGTDANGAAVNATATSATDGTYRFDTLLSGSYTITETPPVGYTPGSIAAGSLNGIVDRNNNRVTGIAVSPGLSGTGYDFAGLGTSLSGNVFIDDNVNGILDAGEPGQTNVTVTLRDGNNNIVATASTNSTGRYTFNNLRAGDYTLAITQPTGYGTSTTTSRVVTLPTTGLTNQNFGLTAGSLSGFVYNDINNDGVKDPNEPGIGGVTVQLRRGAGTGTLVETVTTAGDGSYIFKRLTGDTYRIIETQPSTFLDGIDTAPAGRATVNNDDFRNIVLNPGEILPGFLFGERSQGVSGIVYNDKNGNGSQDQGEEGISGVTITALNGGNTIATTSTDFSGQYVLSGLAPGTYVIQKTQLPGYAPSGPASQTVNLPAEANLRVAFGELTAKLSGSVFVDANADGVRQATEAGVPNVSIRLTGTNAAGTTVDTTVTTNTTGDYSFENLLSGTYTIRQTQPLNFAEGVTPPAGSLGGSVTTNQFSNIVVPAGQPGINYSFPESAASITGKVFVDRNNNGIPDVATDTTPAEPGIAGVILTLRDSTNAIVATATTDASGNYSFTGLTPGTYTVTQTQPVGYGNGTPANNVLNITLAGTGVTDRNFGETLGNLSGFVYVDSNNNGTRDTNERPIPGVTITITGTDVNGAPVSKTAVSGADGSYRFDDLLAGTYRVAETQPADRGDGSATVGSAGGILDGPNAVKSIGMGPAVSATGYNFGERPLSTGRLSGSAYVDANNNGVRDAGEAGIANVTMLLSGIDEDNNAVNLTTTTDATGAFSFTNLRKGVYSVSQYQPTAYIDGKESIGSAGGLNDGLPGTNTTTKIAIGAGQVATGYDFGDLNPNGTLSGYDFIDLLPNGQRRPKDWGTPGTLVVLKGRNDLGQYVEKQINTNPDGSYNFTGLRPGTYQVVSRPRPTLNARKAFPGTQGGVAFNPKKIAGIAIGIGQTGKENNFSNNFKPKHTYPYIQTRTGAPFGQGS